MAPHSDVNGTNKISQRTKSIAQQIQLPSQPDNPYVIASINFYFSLFQYWRHSERSWVINWIKYTNQTDRNFLIFVHRCHQPRDSLFSGSSRSHNFCPVLWIRLLHCLWWAESYYCWRMHSNMEFNCSQWFYVQLLFVNNGILAHLVNIIIIQSSEIYI